MLSLTGGKAALRAATALAPALPQSAFYADLNAGSAALKKQIAAVITEASGALFADVSVVGSVPTHGAQTVPAGDQRRRRRPGRGVGAGGGSWHGLLANANVDVLVEARRAGRAMMTDVEVVGDAAA